ncbi:MULTISPECIES: L-arabinose isomerase [Edwardsiella]|uniref:L-arabinose isomerase n=2 Tax=Edwardsiella anguillarum TaxID=1821960 RepID=A0A076LMU6_9GAMM|nr:MULTISPECIES: L-arabinose isomerase [Edwardsiella]AIJ09825.1 L-arabinose isomerase [Edwardsiella anguillarum ET080813]AKR77511.1 L-arabinose isomerase [Edwardsiella sp. LADL05-105]KAB0589251.1 L-arabinose isomerase [Edwardsiella anguillarum]UOU80569.1 L-arabinose isomerase [Edwardsiella anguillarum]WHP85314.1 L-arabinose isomerase [Edwardsiella anguillarum]
MESMKQNEVWFIVGSQHLYGPEALKQVADHAHTLVSQLNTLASLPLKIVLQPCATTLDEISRRILDANHDARCVGVMVWMHTFSPAKMWIPALCQLQKPLLQFHTQFNRDLPWQEIDMDFMNLNQTAHGGREFGFMAARLRLARSVVVGHWQEPDVWRRLSDWMRLAAAIHDSRQMKIARFGDNMRDVAVTEGDKVEAQIRFGYQVNYYPLGDLVQTINEIANGDVTALIDEYEHSYTLTDAVKRGGALRDSLVQAARQEIGIKRFLQQGGFSAFTTTFEDLHGLHQLPGLACQRLMQQGYGFGAEGDWKTAALLRTIKVMGEGLPGGTSFMEDYTYHLQPGQQWVLGAHMLEVCPSIADERPLLDAQPLGIGGKAAPARLRFHAPAGAACNASLIDMGNRFRLIVNRVSVVDLPQAMPRLPVACALWQPLPDLQTSTEAWILAGAAHHSVFTQAVDASQLQRFAELMGIEFVLIDQETQLEQLKQQLRWNAVYYHLGI